MIKLMEQKNFLVYEAVAGTDIHSAIRDMIVWSKIEGRPVQTTFNGATFSVTADTDPDEAYKQWEQIMDQNAEAYRNAPEGIKAAAEAKARAEKKAKEDAEVSELIKDEVLELTAEKAWKKSLLVNTDPYGSGVVRYAERWGKLMQVEMRQRGASVLTKEIVDATKFRADNEGMSGFSWSCARNLLIQCWKYGAELGKFEGFSADKVQKARRLAEAETGV